MCARKYTPFRGKHGTTWEGGFSVPQMVIWCGHIKPGTVVNDIYYHEDWLPTLLDAVGEPDFKEKLLNGHLKAANYFKSNQK